MIKEQKILLKSLKFAQELLKWNEKTVEKFGIQLLKFYPEIKEILPDVQIFD